jgi:hypothetical protein
LGHGRHNGLVRVGDGGYPIHFSHTWCNIDIKFIVNLLPSHSGEVAIRSRKLERNAVNRSGSLANEIAFST